MVEFSKEDEERYQARVKAREELKARQEKEKAQPTTTEKRVPFTSKIGKKFAGALDKATGKAEAYREKVNYVKDRTGRISKAIAPPKAKRKPSGQPPYQRPVYAKAPKAPRHYQPARPSYQHVSRPRDNFNDFINGPSGSHKQSSSSFFNDMVGGSSSGGKKRKSNSEFFKDFIG